jgi:TATA-binding protein-associated factor Taf7
MWGNGKLQAFMQSHDDIPATLVSATIEEWERCNQMILAMRPFISIYISTHALCSVVLEYVGAAINTKSQNTESKTRENRSELKRDPDGIDDSLEIVEEEETKEDEIEEAEEDEEAEENEEAEEDEKEEVDEMEEVEEKHLQERLMTKAKSRVSFRADVRKNK